MKAAWYERKGPARDVIRFGELPDPHPGPGQVRVRVAVSAVNPTDIKARSGYAGYTAMAGPRVVPHQDGAGTIDATGTGVSEARLGEHVWVYEAQRDGRDLGTAAEYVVVPEANAVPLPQGVPFDVGACLGVPAMTAHRCLFMDGGIQGQTVLVAGGAGAVGSATVQLAKWSGARVLATVSREEQAEVARAAGADVVVYRKTQDVAERVMEATGGEGVDRVVEVDLEANVVVDRTVLKPNGVVACYAAPTAESAPHMPFAQQLWKALTVHWVLVYLMPPEAHRAAARDVNACLRAGRYRPHVARRFRLDEVAAAHEAQESGKVIGKLLVDVTP